MDFTHFMEWAFLGLMTGGVYILWLLKETVSDLNVKMAILITEHEESKKNIHDHEARLRHLEKTKKHA